MAKAPRTISNPKVLARIELGKKRLQSVLSRHTVAMARTLEQKISDAGPSGQRVDPAYLTKALQELRAEGRVTLRWRNESSGSIWQVALKKAGRTGFDLCKSDNETVQESLGAGFGKRTSHPRYSAGSRWKQAIRFRWLA